MDSMASTSTSSGNTTTELTAEQLAQIERNRQKALLLKQQKQKELTTEQVYQLEKYQQINNNKSIVTQDQGGGYFIKPQEDEDEKIKRLFEASRANNKKAQMTIKEDTREHECDECEDRFSNSYLLANFGEYICDQCKDLHGRHQLITRTECKQQYLLNDVDLDKREPPLKYIIKKNPHEFARGHMKLYLKFQVEERALEVWKSEENLENERHLREEKRQQQKHKRYQKQMKQLRMEARSSMFKKRLTSTSGHEHQFGDETPVEAPDDDPDGEYYQQICTICGLKKVFEKM